MSRIGDTEILAPKEATLSVEGSLVVIKGPKGELTLSIPKGISVVSKEPGTFTVEKRE